MTASTSRLRRRVACVEERFGVPETRLRIDVSALTGAEADRLRLLVSRSEANSATDAELDELNSLLATTLTVDDGTSGPSPFTVPKALERYWRFQSHVAPDWELPGGNYRFQSLSYAARERLLELCIQYGWQPDANVVCIASLSDWAEGDRETLADILWDATSVLEQEMWGRRSLSFRQAA